MKRSFSLRSLRWLVVPAILVGGIAVWYLDAIRFESQRADVVRSVDVVQPVRMDIEERFSLRGYVETDRIVTILPLVSGPIEDLPVDVGDAVFMDQVIAQIDRERYALDLAQADASLAAAESTFLRTRQLYEANATAVQNFEQARAQYEAARSQRDLAQLQLDYTSVRSPIDGVVLTRHLSTGDVVGPDRPIVTVGDIDALVVRPAVPEQRYPEFLIDPDSIIVRIATNNRTYSGRIRTVAPLVAAATRTFEVVCDIEGDLSLLRPGMSVTVTFVPSTRRDVLTLPIDALGYGDTLWYVEEDRARRLSIADPVVIGDRVELPDEYEGFDFIVAGQHFVDDGQGVAPREAAR